MNKVTLSKLSDDSYLEPYLDVIEQRAAAADERERVITQGESLASFASAHHHFGLHRTEDGWVFREWAPAATEMFLVGEHSDWEVRQEFTLSSMDHGEWMITLPADTLKHGDLYRLHIRWKDGSGDRIPAYARRTVQDPHTHIFNAQVWMPETEYIWKSKPPLLNKADLYIYEAHIGMAQEDERVGTFSEFKEHVLPRIAEAGYNALQIMALMEHPYYGSFGYHVSSFFAASSRFGTPEELKELIDAAHAAGLTVIMDIVHSHAVKNEYEGLSRFDGTAYQYFHEGARGYHPAWDSLCFDYSKPQVLHFLLSNCRFWLEEYHIDGFRFDGVTSMLYHDRGLGASFTSYDRYFDESLDTDALTYLTLANRLIHDINPNAVTIAEDVSGLPGLAAPSEDMGCGFDYRLAMGVPDVIFKLINDVADENWDIGWLWHELSNRRDEERTISYAESHDQALVGGKSMAFELIDEHMYHSMSKTQSSIVVDRGIALHNMLRLMTLCTASFGYMNFMGNEFGHPEWIDFPREGNNWSYKHARRLWSLRDRSDLRYHFLADFDRAMINRCRADNIFDYRPEQTYIHNDDKVISVRRGDTIFIFNFHPSKSYADYPIDLEKGEYKLLLSTDFEEFGGGSRVSREQSFFTKSRDGRTTALFYIPSRTALVIRKV